MTKSAQLDRPEIISTHLKEPLQPPHLEDTLAHQNAQLEDAPPLHAGIGALRRVSMCPLPDNDIGLFIPDLR